MDRHINISDTIERMKFLMGENYEETPKADYYGKIEYIKEGPDGKKYAIISENHKYVIKVCNENKENPLNSDFEYIGGYMNKSQNEYTGYNKALKMLQEKFIAIRNDMGVLSENVEPINFIDVNNRQTDIDITAYKIRKDLERQFEINRIASSILKENVNESQIDLPEAPSIAKYIESIGKPFEEKGECELDKDPADHANDQEEQGKPYEEKAEFDANPDVKEKDDKNDVNPYNKTVKEGFNAELNDDENEYQDDDDTIIDIEALKESVLNGGMFDQNKKQNDDKDNDQPYTNKVDSQSEDQSSEDVIKEYEYEEDGETLKPMEYSDAEKAARKTRAAKEPTEVYPDNGFIFSKKLPFEYKGKTDTEDDVVDLGEDVEPSKKTVLKVDVPQEKKTVDDEKVDIDIDNSDNKPNNNSFENDFDAGVEADEESDPKKYIQQLTGKLASVARKYAKTNNDDETIKFVINSLIPATVPYMTDDDKSDVIKKVKEVKPEEDNSDSDNLNIEKNDNIDTDLKQDGLKENRLSEDELNMIIEEVFNKIK